MTPLPLFSDLQDQLDLLGVQRVIEALTPSAESNPAARLIQSALELSAKVLSEDTSQLAAQLIGRLRVHRDNPDIAAFLSGITPPVGTLQALDTGYSTHIAAQMSDTPTEIAVGLPSGIKSFQEFTDGTLQLDTVYGQWRGKLGDPAGFQRVSDQRPEVYNIPPQLLEAHGGHVRGTRVLRDGRTLSWAGDYTLSLWDAQMQPLQVLVGHTKGVHGAIEHSDGRIISWSKDATLRSWSSEGDALTVIIGHQKLITGAIEVSGGRILSWSQDYTLRLWSSDGTALAVMVGHTAWVESALELPDGRFLSWSLGELVLRVWRPDGQLDGVFEGSLRSIRLVQAFPDGRVICAGYGKTVIWTLSMLSPLPDAAHPAIVQGMTGLPDGRFLSWSFGHDLTVWSRDGQKIDLMIGHNFQIYGAVVIENGNILSWANGSRYHTKSVHLHDSNGVFVRSFMNREEVESDIFKSTIQEKDQRITFPNGNYVIWEKYPSTSLGELVLYAPDGSPQEILVGESIFPDGLYKDTFYNLLGHTNGLWLLAEGKLLAWARAGHGYLWDSSGKLIARLSKPEFVHHATMLTDNLFVVYHERFYRLPADLYIYDLDGVSHKKLHAHSTYLTGAHVVKNKCIVTWASDCSVRVWDAQTFEQTHAFYMDYAINACAVLSESPLRLAIGDESGRIAVVEATG